MLPLRKHWHNASERSPEREARLLWFADTADDDKKPNPAEAGIVLPTPDDPKERGEDVVSNETDTTAGNIEKVLSGPKKKTPEEAEQEFKIASQQKEVMRKRFEEVTKKMAENAGKIRDLKDRMKSEVVMKNIRESASPEILARWENDIRLLNQEEFNTTQEKDFTEHLSSFWMGELAPQEFAARYADYLNTLPYGFGSLDKIAKMEEMKMDVDAELGIGAEGESDNATPSARSTIGLTKEKWAVGNASDKIDVINTIVKDIDIDKWMQIKNKQYGKMEKALQQQEGYVEKVEKQSRRIDLDAETDFSKTQGIGAMLRQIRWRSINDYINGGVKYWNALKSTWETRSERYSADIARKIGSAMRPFDFFPIYGEEVDTILGQQLDAKDGEEEEAMKKTLEENHFTWSKVFDKDGGEFWKWAGKNANKTRGCLAWAAEHGFLYDIDENLDDHSHPIFGMKVADLCFDWKGDDSKISNYFNVLRSKNSSGREHEIDHGKKMENDVENVPRFIRLVEHELDLRNLWGAAGICQRAMERGLQGHVAAWLFTTIMSKLKEHKDLRAVTPVSFFDIIGKMSMYNTAFTMGWMKGLRPKLAEWAATGDDDILEKTPIKYANDIEKTILARSPSIDIKKMKGRQELNELTARVLAGHIVELPDGSYIHIFESRFSPYRQRAREMFASMADPHKEDPDFAIEDTEKIMLGTTVYKEILAYTSTREWESEKWVQPFLGSIISMGKRLRGIPELADAHANYCKDMQEKLGSHFSALLTENLAFKQLSTLDNDGKPAIASLIAENMLSWDLMKNAVWADKIKEALKQFHPDFYWKHVFPTEPAPGTEPKAPEKKAKE